MEGVGWRMEEWGVENGGGGGGKGGGGGGGLVGMGSARRIFARKDRSCAILALLVPGCGAQPPLMPGYGMLEIVRFT